MGFENCDESKTMPVSWINFYYTNENLSKYSKVMEEVCKENGVLFMNTIGLANSDFEDGLHPNALGHKKLFEQVKSFLVKNEWI